MRAMYVSPPGSRIRLTRKSLTQLLKKFPDFRRAYDEDGLSLAEFDTFGPTVRTLRQFLEATHELAVRVRDLLLPNPDGSAS